MSNTNLKNFGQLDFRKAFVINKGFNDKDKRRKHY